MKFYFFLFLLLIPIASAIYGGESYIRHFDKCNNLTVWIEANMSIDNGEYVLNDNCRKITNNVWNCNCTDGYDFNFTTKINTINYYTLTFDYNYTQVEDEDSGGSSGGSSGGGSSGGYYNYTYKPKNTTKVNNTNKTIVKPIVNVEPPVEVVVTQPPPANITPTKEPVKPKSNAGLIVLVISIILIISGIGFAIWKFIIRESD